MKKCKVYFSEKITSVIIEHRSELPCIQNYLEDYKICKKQHIEHTYLIEHGNMVGFNYIVSMALHNLQESIEEEQDTFEQNEQKNGD